MNTLVILAPDYFQEKLPESQWTYHYEVRRNFGTEDQPHWETIHYSSSEEAAREWAKVN